MLIVEPCTKGPGGTPCGLADPAKPPRGQCKRCWINAHTREELKEKARIRTFDVVVPGQVTKKVKVRKPLPCIHRGEKLKGPERQALYDSGQTWVDHGRVWRLCGKPGFELEGQAVCTCESGSRPRCGPSCLGYQT